jgi:hypothetical protein
MGASSRPVTHSSQALGLSWNFCNNSGAVKGAHVDHFEKGIVGQSSRFQKIGATRVSQKIARTIRQAPPDMVDAHHRARLNRPAHAKAASSDRATKSPFFGPCVFPETADPSVAHHAASTGIPCGCFSVFIRLALSIDGKEEIPGMWCPASRHSLHGRE